MPSHPGNELETVTLSPRQWRALGFLSFVAVLLVSSLGCGVSDPIAAGGDNLRAVSSPAMARLRSRQHAHGYDFVLDGSGALRNKAGCAGNSAVVTATGRGVRLSGRAELGIETTSIGRDGTYRAARVIERGVRVPRVPPSADRSEREPNRLEN
jgi:hypothetical protein